MSSFLGNLKRLYYNLRNDGYIWENNHLNIYMITVVPKELSGLPNLIAIDDAIGWNLIDNKKYIQVENSYQNTIDIFDTIKLSIEDNPQILSHNKIKISKKDLGKIKKWVVLNKKYLLKMAKPQSEYDYYEFERDIIKWQQ